MKIVDLVAHVLSTPLEEPFAFSQGRVRRRSAVVVEVVTDEGVTGWGESLCHGLQPPEGSSATADGYLSPDHRIRRGPGTAAARGITRGDRWRSSAFDNLATRRSPVKRMRVNSLALPALSSRPLSPIRLVRIASRLSLRGCSVQLSCCALSFGTCIGCVGFAPLPLIQHTQ